LPSRLRVPLGYLTGVAVLALARPVPLLVVVGLVLAAAGEGIRLWASGHIEKGRALATGGPYAHTRNPLYLGSIVMALGAAVASASPWVVLAVCVYLVAFYPSVVRSEAAFLRSRFPAEYEEWSRAVPLFLPRLTPGGPRLSAFDWKRVRQNREWRAAAAVPAIAFFFYVRSLF
jgi:protein-S-isoprenylcysteine O-methyltransferase Ste14